MRRAAIFTLSMFAWQSLHAAPSARSVSPSRQFIIYGADAALRGAVSELVEQTKANLLAVLQQRDNWKAPVLVNLQPQQVNLPEVPPAALRFSQTGFGVKLQLDLMISQNLDASLVERELLRAILLEMIYRNEPHIVPGTAYVQPPDWLVDGLLAFAPGRDRRALIEALSTADKAIPLEEFLHQRSGVLDSAGRVLHSAYSLALLQLLIDGMDGPARLTRYIGNLSRASNDSLVDLKAQFPLLAGQTEERWHLAITRLSSLHRYQLLTFAQSEQRLGELLLVKLSDINKSVKLIRLNEFTQHKTSKNEKMALSQLSHDLLLFAVQANPALRPVVREYQQIATLLARDRRRGIAKRLVRLDDTREKLTARMRDIDDYMNWFEATQMTHGSGNFTEYLKAAYQSQPLAPTRRDPLSTYLDALEDQFRD